MVVLPGAAYNGAMQVVPRQMITVEEVWSLLADHVRPLDSQRVSSGGAVGRVLAEDVRAGFDFPPFDRAMMDGYAVRSSDFERGPATLRPLGLSRAGAATELPVEPGTCVQINTGAPLPAGADAVVMVEKSAAAGDHVHLDDQPHPGQHVTERGAMRTRDDLVLRAGTRLTPGGLAAIVSAGVAEISVFRTPRVAVLVTGDELAHVEGPRAPDQIIDSNGTVLVGLIAEAGAAPIVLPAVGDDREALRARITEGLDCDLLCVTGGMSKGTHDFVPEILSTLGVQWHVTSLKMKPGKPTHVGRAPNGAWVLGLPGNPVSCAVCFLLIGRWLARGLQGLPTAPPGHFLGTVAADLPGNGPRPLYQPARWSPGPRGENWLTPSDWQGSGDPFGFATANALLIREAGAPPLPRGDSIRFIPFDESA